MTPRKVIMALLAMTAMVAAYGTGHAQEKVILPAQVQSIRYSADWRLRYETFERSGPGTNDRARYRWRLRLGTETSLPHTFMLGFRLASGTGEQVSTNQTLDNLSAQKPIWIDNLYLRWARPAGANGNVFLQGGRMPNPLWRLTTSDLIWDDDFAPEGFAEGGEWLVADGHLSVFVNALQMIADEDSKTDNGQWVFSEQLGIETRLPMQSRLRIAGGYNRWIRETRDDFGQAAVQDGNRRKPDSNALMNEFGTGELTAQVSTWVASVPVVFLGTFAKNLRAKDLSPKADEGYQAGIIVGRARLARSWEVAYFRKSAESDVTPADVADSDFGDGGTNREGNIVWAAFSPEEWMQLRLKFFDTETLDTSLSPGEKNVDRFQGDFLLRF